MNYQVGDHLDKFEDYECIVCNEKYAVFAKVTIHEGDKALDCEDVLVYSNVLREKEPSQIEKVINYKK